MSRSNIQEANGDKSGPAGQFLAYFRPPVSSNYTFVSAVDDSSRLWINLDRTNASAMELLIDSTMWSSQRDWCDPSSLPFDFTIRF